MNTDNFLFVYGILKRGYALDLLRLNAEFVAEAELSSSKLYRIGNGVGLRFVKDPFRVAYGEIFNISKYLWPYLDEVEGNGLIYTRKRVVVHLKEDHQPRLPVSAWVYEHTYPGTVYSKRTEILSGRF